jgi:hypothetical protein
MARVPRNLLVYSSARGVSTGIYLYPIIDVDKLGYAHVALNALVLLCVFLAQAFSWSQSRAGCRCAGLPSKHIGHAQCDATSSSDSDKGCRPPVGP